MTFEIYKHMSFKKISKQPKTEVKKEIQKKNLDDFGDFSELLEERGKNTDIDQQLEEIYENEELAPVTEKDKKNKSVSKYKVKNYMTTLQRGNDNPWRRIAITFLIFLFVLTGSSWVGFYIFNVGSRLDNEDIEFSIEGTEEAIAGQEVVYTLQYKNLSQFNLYDIEIKVKYPQGIIPLDTVPAADHDSDIWLMNQIETKRSGRIQIKALAVASVDTEQTLSASINYRPENFSSIFDATADFTTKISSIGINVDVEAPSFFNLNQEAEIILNYTQAKEHFFDSFVISLEHKDNFKTEADSWTIKDLSEKENSLKIKGKYTSQPSADDELKIILSLPYASAANEGEVLYADFFEYVIKPTVIEGALNINLSVNGSTADKAVNAGETLNYVVHYKNTSDAVLKDVIIMAVVDSVAVDWESLNDRAKGEIRGNTIIWTKEEITGLESISPGKEDSFSFSIAVKGWDKLKDEADSQLRVVGYADYSVDSAVAKANQGARLINLINSDLALKNELRYFDRNNVAVGAGPLPPKVGEKTIYRVYWSLTNSRHDLTGIEVSTILPAATRWENDYNISAGSVSYNTNTREISWRIDSWDAIDEPAMADFAVSIIPGEADKNKIVSVINGVNLEAKDIATNGIITKSDKAKTTNLDDDEVGKGYGKVE